MLSFKLSHLEVGHSLLSNWQTDINLNYCAVSRLHFQLFITSMELEI